MTDLAVLNHAEQVALEECERVIADGLKTFVAVGSSLAFVRNNRLYRGTHETFEGYCQERWGFRRQRANELIAAAQLVDEISSTDLPAPANEAQAVALSRVPEPERAEVWREAVERTDGKPTAKAIKAVREERTQTPGSAGTAPPADPGPTQDAEPLERAADAPTDVAADPVAMVAAALEKYVPDPGAEERAWRKTFYEQVRGPHKFLLWADAGTAAQHADSQDIETLRLLAEGYADLHRRVLAERNGNVRSLRRVQ